ncbi:RadC family protein [Pediococcus siamensis]|uniref:RadC family protein n=1 Tax=Pediococcus siamensis TaxID=381829 RepID=UPI00399FCB6D
MEKYGQLKHVEVPNKKSNELAQFTNEELLQLFLTERFPEKQQAQLIQNFWELLPDLSLFSLLYNEERAQIFSPFSSLNRQFLAAVELGRRIELAPQKIIGEVFGSRQVGERLIQIQRRFRQEQLTLFCLNTKNKIIYQKVIFKGSLNSATVHPREIFHEALRIGTNKIMITHNHPSGEIKPSKQDISFTKRLKECGVLLGIELLDHIITGSENYYSFAEQRLL